MLVVQGEAPPDWIAISAASAISWGRRVEAMMKERRALPPWAAIPPRPGSVLYRADRRTDTWTFGSRDVPGSDEGVTFEVAAGDCDTLAEIGAGVRLATRRKARIVTVANGERGHVFETDTEHTGRGFALWDMSVWGGMTPLSRDEYNLSANIAVIEWAPDGSFSISLHYGIRPLVIV